MKEKYIFFTLLVIAIVMLVGSSLGKSTEGEITAREQVIKKKVQRAVQRRLVPPKKIAIDKIEDLVAFSHYEEISKRSPFFKVKTETTAEAGAESEIIPVEEKMPLFLYKGKIALGKRLVVIIAQTNSNEVFMVSQGENVDGYKVLDITDTEVILSKTGEENIVLKTTERP